MNLKPPATAAPAKRLTDAYQAAERVIASHSRTFQFATRLLPPAPRRAIHALYAFCRTTDDLVDCREATVAEIEAWRRKVALPMERQEDPLLLAWSDTRERYGIDKRFETELIDGVRMDAEKRSYETFSELKEYCYRVASTVGLLSMPIIGYADGANFSMAAPYAIQLGIALQMTNILRDVGEDAKRGRVYFPKEDLASYGLTIQDVFDLRFDSRFLALMQFEIQRTRQLYRDALPGIRFLHPAARPAVGAAALLYRAILDRIEANGYDVLRRRAHTTFLQKMLLLPGIFWAVSRLPEPRLASQA